MTLKHRRPAPDRGSATVLVVGSAALLLLLLGILVGLGSALAAGGSARAAADLAALGGAGRLIAGEGEARACTVAADLAHRNGARQVDCAAYPAAGPDRGPRLIVLVEVEHHLPGIGPAQARAQAGGVPPPG